MYLAEILEENVYYYKNVVDDTKTFVDLLEKCDKDESMGLVVPKWNNWNSSSSDGVIFGGKKDLDTSALQSLSGEAYDKSKYLIDKIKKAIDDVATSFVRDKGLDISPNISPFVGVGKYTPGCMMGPHFDRQAGDRTLWWSIIIYWNDDYEGGEISFIIRDKDLRLPENDIYRPKDDLSDPENEKLIDFWLKPEAGSALIFPSTEPYRHMVHVMKSGDKYISPGFIFVDGYDPENEEDRIKHNAAGIHEDN